LRFRRITGTATAMISKPIHSGVPDHRARLSSNAALPTKRAAPSAAERAERVTAKKSITAAANKAPITAMANAAMRSPCESMTPARNKMSKPTTCKALAANKAATGCRWINVVVRVANMASPCNVAEPCRLSIVDEAARIGE
jgi:hypothetical protein